MQDNVFKVSLCVFNMTITGIIIVVSWVIVLAYWTFEAFFQKKVKKNSNVKSRIFYSLVLLLSYILLLFSSKIYFLDYLLIHVSVFVNMLAILLAVGGMIICIYSRKVLGSNWSREVMIKKNHELITTGPYKYIRHPIYSGLLMLFLGTALAIGNLGSLLGFVLLVINFKIKSLNEEEFMLKCFGKKYEAYMKRTKGFMPGVY